MNANRQELKYSFVIGQFAVCSLPVDSPIPEWVFRGAFHSVTRTSNELSIVCPTENIPVGVEVDAHWTCFKLAGPFPLQAVGILASFINPLADHGIAVLPIATFETDYVFIREEFIGYAIAVLREAGHELTAD